MITIDRIPKKARVFFRPLQKYFTEPACWHLWRDHRLFVPFATILTPPLGSPLRSALTHGGHGAEAS